MNALANEGWEKLPALKPVLPMTNAERARFWSYVDKRGEGECWPWLGAVTKNEGRGRFTLRRESFSAPRVAYALTFGEPAALVCHTCDNPPCCNPGHFFLGTHADNVHDCIAKGRTAGQKQTHCKHGHEFTPENTRLRRDGRGKRMCRTCDRERERIYKARRKLENLHVPKPADYRQKKTCKRGHPLSGDNILLSADTKGRRVRRCKICRQASEARRWGWGTK